MAVSEHLVRFALNGAQQERRVAGDRLLIDMLREDLGLTGTKRGCSVGVCGTCTVLIDGRMMSSCLILAAFVDGTAVRTIEGIAAGGLSSLQSAFVEQGGLQCGICTPGQVIAATALLEHEPRPTPEAIRAWMMGNLCRCTGYLGIERAIRDAARA